MASMSEGNRKGQSLVEFALVVPMLLLLVFGIVEFGRAWMVKNILTSAAREAVRVAVVQSDISSATTAASSRAQNVLNSANITSYDFDLNAPTGEDTATVTITYDFPVIVASVLPGLGDSIPLSSSSTMKKEFLP